MSCPATTYLKWSNRENGVGGCARGGGAGRSGEPELTPGTRLAALWPYLVPEGGWVGERSPATNRTRMIVNSSGGQSYRPPSLNTTTFPIAEIYAIVTELKYT